MSLRAVFSPETQCKGKRGYSSKKIARDAARHHETNIGGGRLETYRCPHCGWWHNGHRPPGAVLSARVES